MSRVGGWIRKLKGIAGMAVLWSGASAVFGVVATVVTQLVIGSGFPPLAELFTGFWQWALIGGGAGSIFGGTVSLLYAKKDLRQIHPFGFGVVGALAGIASMFLLFVAVGYIGRPGFAPIIALNLSFGGLLGWSTSRFAIDAAREAPRPLPAEDEGSALLDVPSTDPEITP